MSFNKTSCIVEHLDSKPEVVTDTFSQSLQLHD